jgi:hypothetical protein
MYTLCINDDNGQTQDWWMNFLLSLPSDAGHNCVTSDLKKWGATIPYDRNGYSDTIVFDKEENLAWFLLKWT